MRRSRFI